MAPCSSPPASPRRQAPSSWGSTPTTRSRSPPAWGSTPISPSPWCRSFGGNWQLALALVFVSGVLFFALSLSPLRAWLIDAIPMSLKLGIAAGIGFFLALIALQNAGIVADDPVTLVTLGDLSKPQAWLAAAGSCSSRHSPCARCRVPSSSACSPSRWPRWRSDSSPGTGSSPPRLRSRRPSSRWISPMPCNSGSSPSCSRCSW